VIVLDASVAIDTLLQVEPVASLVRRWWIDADPVGEGSLPTPLAAPHLLDAEVGHVLRRHARRGDIEASAARQLLDDLIDLPLVRFDHAPLLERAWELRGNVTFYDALYLALAEALDAPLWTRDAALAGVPGCAAEVVVLPGA
jgi:predicted nucleic acid-binding protein